MKKLNLLFTALLLLCCVGSAKAEEVTIDGIRYDVVTKAKQATVIKDETKYTGNFVIPSTVLYNGTEYNVVGIGEKAFAGATLSEITIPASIRNIGSNAFRGCSIGSVHIDDITAWLGIDFAGSFANPLGCAKSLYLNEKEVVDLVIPDGVVEIPAYAFYEYSALESVVIPDCVVDIKKYAFASCSSLKNVKLGSGVISIGYYAFYNCDSIEEFEIPNSVTTVEGYAFESCSNLKEVTVGNGVTKFDGSAFSGCDAIEKVCISDVAAWCAINFAGTPFKNGAALYLNGEELTELVIDYDIKKINANAFNKCPSIVKVQIIGAVDGVGERAFYGCPSLKEVTVSYSVSSIGYNAFDGCNALERITLEGGNTSIWNEAFANCENLTDVYVLSANAPSAQDDSFEGSMPEYMTLHVPAGTADVYGNASPWNTFGKIMDDAEMFEDPWNGEYTLHASVTSLDGREYPTSWKVVFEYQQGIKGYNSWIISEFGSDEEIHYPGIELEITSAKTARIKEGIVQLLDENNESSHLGDIELTDVVLTANGDGTIAMSDFSVSNRSKSCADYKNVVLVKAGADVEPGTPSVPRCAAPVISYCNGKLSFESETEGAEFITQITSNDINSFYSNIIDLSATYNISVYATATGHENSETVNATLCWIECECDGSDDTNVISIPAKAVLVTSNGGVLSISCSLDGEEVAVYATNGTLIATTTIENGMATVSTGLSKGTVAIVKIAGKSIKVALN